MRNIHFNGSAVSLGGTVSATSLVLVEAKRGEVEVIQALVQNKRNFSSLDTNRLL